MKLILLATLLLAALPCFAARTVVDETGKHITVPDHPHRIICLVPSITDSVFALGAGDDVVGISDYVEYPKEARSKPSVGNISDPSLEAILALRPDLVLGIPLNTQQAELDKIAKLGIPVFLVDPHGLPGIFHSLLSLGTALHREPEAQALVASLQRRVNAVRKSAAGKPVISVFVPISYEPGIITIGHGAFIGDLIEAAGGHSITADLPQEWTYISMETVVARAPQALLMMRDGQVTLDALRERPGWNTLPAVKNRRVYLMDKRMDFPSPIAIEALEDLAKQFHPQ
jgi:iron complex transport system substrate-binding protein